MHYLVYILYSEKLKRFYIGTTDNIERRLEEHNSGKFSDSFTKNGNPWLLYFVIYSLTSEQAYKIEVHIKKMKSSKYFENLTIYPVSPKQKYILDLD